MLSAELSPAAPSSATRAALRRTVFSSIDSLCSNLGPLLSFYSLVNTGGRMRSLLDELPAGSLRQTAEKRRRFCPAAAGRRSRPGGGQHALDVARDQVDL